MVDTIRRIVGDNAGKQRRISHMEAGGHIVDLDNIDRLDRDRLLRNKGIKHIGKAGGAVIADYQHGVFGLLPVQLHFHIVREHIAVFGFQKQRVHICFARLEGGDPRRVRAILGFV